MQNNRQTYIIAEAGVNHNGDRDMAYALIDAAVSAGANAVKFQTFNAAGLATKNVPKAAYQRHTTGIQDNQATMLRKLELPLEWHSDLQQYAANSGITFLSTAFEHDSLEFLQKLDLPLYKIPSGEITNGPLLWAFAQTARPLILSTGMATLGEIEQALAVIAHGLAHNSPPENSQAIWQCWADEKTRAVLQQRVTLLHCTSQYPAPLTEVNLNAMNTLTTAFNLRVGYSDHTQGLLVSIAAVAKGASVIEKHFTLDRSLPGPDHAASLEPEELAQLVKDIRTLETALGEGCKAPQESEWDTRLAARQSLIAAVPIKKGQPFTSDNMRTSRVGEGLSPMHYWDRCDQLAERDYDKDEPL